MLDQIKSQLGKPYYEGPHGILYNMDCLIGLKKMMGINIISTITSPPYNIGKEYETVQPSDNYVNWLASIFERIYSLTSLNGSLLLNLGYLKIEGKGHAIPIPYLLWDKISFYLNQEIIWHYGAGVSSKKYLSPRNEKVLWYVKDKDNYTFNLDDIRDPDVKYPNQKKNGKLRCNTIGKNPSDVWSIAKVTSGSQRSSHERTPHPAQFPEDLIRRLVLGFTNKGDLLLDPFMGSGTVGAIAIELDRKFVGFEINADYCEIAKRRLIAKESERFSTLDFDNGYAPSRSQTAI
ncbi:MAG: site-specific DNA-methyltransferase [Muribaculaceae bacterium]|nr:site-specific DNA-methyltransferase [Muribaculaceae bacterium]